MTLARNTRAERYRGGRTLEVPVVKDSGLLSIKECATLLHISSRNTINEYLKCLGLFGRDFLSWEELREVLSLQRFLGLKHGQNSKKQYLFLRDRGHIERIFQEFNINLNKEIERIQDGYYQR